MAKNYVTMAPNGRQVNISVSEGTFVFVHGQEMSNEAVAKQFPNIFIEKVVKAEKAPKLLQEVPSAKEVIDESPAKVEVLTETVPEISLPQPEEIVDEVIEEVIAAPVKSKGGRPKGSKNKG